MSVKKHNRFFFTGNHRSVRKRKRGFIPLFSVILLLLSSAFFIETKAPSIIYAMAEDRAKTIAIQAINNAVSDVLDENSDICQKLVKFTFDEEGNIISADTDTALTNAIEGMILDGVVSRIDSSSRYPIKIPVGTLTGSDLLTGRGFPLTFYINLTSNAKSSIENLFESTGINQTRHQIQIHFEVDVSIVMSGKHFGATVENTVVIGETIIVGKIPDAYVKQP